MTGEPMVRVLGPVRLPSTAGREAEPSGALLKRLVVALALAGADGRSVAGLTDDLWPDEPPRNPRGAVQMLVSRTRATVADGMLASTATGYRIADADLLHAERADAAGAASALALWTGEPGADLEPSGLADELRARAAAARARLLRLHGSALLEAGRAAEAVPVLEELAAAAPLDAAAAGLLMRALAEQGRTEAALAAFATHRELVADALGADPDPDLVALNVELLRPRDASAPELVGVRAFSTTLLGREADLARLVETVPAGRLTSIVGTGGLGKTRLAQETAVRLQDRFERIVFTELAGAVAAEDVALVVGAAVGARAAQAPRRLGDPLPADLATRTREALGARRTLLVLDNCEHVVDAAAQQTADLLADVPSLTVLTTTRVPLLLPGEAIVAPAPLPAATTGSALFVERAAAARPGAALDAAVVERVCARLDGLPLAIELAAARLRSMTLLELDRRLEDRFAVLIGGDRTAPDRHRTLLAVIEWSRRLLSPAAGEALGPLALFPDGFTGAAADDLLGSDATDVLAELVDQSLLGFSEGRDGRARYRMLETVREYGLRDLAEHGRLDAARAALDGWALRFARRTAPGLLAGIDPAAARAVAEEEENLVPLLRSAASGRETAVLGVAALLTEHWFYRTDFEAVLDAAPLVLAAAARRPADDAARDDAIRALTLASAGALLSGLPSAPRALALLRRAVGLGRPRGFWAVIAAEGVLVPTREGLGAALARLTASADPLVAAIGHFGEAQLLENQGAAAQALAHLARAERIAARHGYPWVELLTRMSTASLLSQRGDRAAALALARAVREEAGAARWHMDVTQMDWLIAAAETGLGELDAAETRFRRLLDRGSHDFNAADDEAIARAGLAEVLTARGAQPEARAAWDRARTAGRAASASWYLVVHAAALAAAPGLGAGEAELLERYRRLRVLLLVTERLQRRAIFDAPVLGSGLLGAVAALEAADPALAAELAGLALALSPRRDLPSIDAVARRHVAADVPADEAARRAIALLRSPAGRR